MARYELTDAEWKIIAPLLPDKMRGVKRVDDRRVFWRAAGVWDQLLKTVSQAYNGYIQMIDSSVVRVDQHAANGEKKAAEAVAWAVPAAGSRPKSTPSSMRKAYRSISS